jgi:hypothetical protein
LGFDHINLPYPKSTTKQGRRKIAASGQVVFELFCSSGVKLTDQNFKENYELTNKVDSFNMLTRDRDFGVHQTAPQTNAAALIISAIALQAEQFRRTFGYANGKRSGFEVVLGAMDKLTDAVGPLADHPHFLMDVQMAAAGIHEHLDGADIFDGNGICVRSVLQSQVEKLCVVLGGGPVETIEYLQDAKSVDIVRAVRRAGIFDFSVGTANTTDEKFMVQLAGHLENQHKAAFKLH